MAVPVTGGETGPLPLPEGAEIESLETHLLLEAIFLKYGYDFRHYARASIKRRIRSRLDKLGLDSVSQLQHDILRDPVAFEGLLLDLSVRVTEMFRDPSFFLALRRKVLPQLADRSHLKVWHAGCATGEEVYSMAILLREAGLLERTRIYATDMSESVVQEASKGVFPLARIREYTASYQQAGGTESFADYYTARYDSAIINASLRARVVFSTHNLVTDGVFGEMDVVVCRNVLIYFDRTLQHRAVQLFADSLREGGLLCIGAQESIRFARSAQLFENFEPGEKICRKAAEAPSAGRT